MSRSETESGRDGFMGVPGSEKSSVHRLSASRPGGKRWLGRHVLTAERAGHNYYLPLDAGGKHFPLHHPRRRMPFELQPTLTGDLLELRPLREADFDALFAVAADPLIWEQHPESDRYRED